MIDFSVVVLPAPLRPSSVTTSPCAISNATPCRMCDSPYHACRSRTSRSGVAADAAVALGIALAMSGAHVRLDDGRIRRYRLVVALREHLATREDGDVIRQRRDDGQVVLDHQHRPVDRHLLDQRGDALDVLCLLYTS